MPPADYYNPTLDRSAIKANWNAFQPQAPSTTPESNFWNTLPANYAAPGTTAESPFSYGSDPLNPRGIGNRNMRGRTLADLPDMDALLASVGFSAPRSNFMRGIQ